MLQRSLCGLILLLCGYQSCQADDIAHRPAIQKSLDLLHKSGKTWMQNQTCFSCHHQPLPMLAFVKASNVGFEPAQGWRKEQADLTHRYFNERIKAMLAGNHIPGGAATTVYGLWALMLDGRPADDTTTAMVTYLLKIQGVTRLDETPAKEAKQISAWPISCSRPPLNGSRVGNTVLALLGIKHYATKEQQPAVVEAMKRATEWLRTAKLTSTEDLAWRIRGLHLLNGDPAELKEARALLVKQQHEDGGWGQEATMNSDAFATGQAMFALRESGTPQTDAKMQLATTWLLKNQLPDGSWLVKTRVKPVQPDYDNGDPHGKNQFISIAATSWATAALAQMLPRVSK